MYRSGSHARGGALGTSRFGHAERTRAMHSMGIRGAWRGGLVRPDAGSGFTGDNFRSVRHGELTLADCWARTLLAEGASFGQAGRSHTAPRRTNARCDVQRPHAQERSWSTKERTKSKPFANTAKDAAPGKPKASARGWRLGLRRRARWRPAFAARFRGGTSCGRRRSIRNGCGPRPTWEAAGDPW